jgi:hypothetical protein
VDWTPEVVFAACPVEVFAEVVVLEVATPGEETTPTLTVPGLALTVGMTVSIELAANKLNNLRCAFIFCRFSFEP